MKTIMLPIHVFSGSVTMFVVETPFTYDPATHLYKQDIPVQWHIPGTLTIDRIELLAPDGTILGTQHGAYTVSRGTFTVEGWSLDLGPIGDMAVLAYLGLFEPPTREEINEAIQGLRVIEKSLTRPLRARRRPLRASRQVIT